jgi:hypothetical protein
VEHREAGPLSLSSREAAVAGVTSSSREVQLWERDRLFSKEARIITSSFLLVFLNQNIFNLKIE